MVISDVLDKIRLLFIFEKKPFLLLKSILGFYPHNIDLYRMALIHKSVAYYEREKRKKEQQTTANKAPKDKATQAVYSRINNERLEFLGDAVLGAIVSDILYQNYGKKQEGFLTNLRSKLVCRRTLNKLAVDLGLDKLIRHTGAVTTGHNSFMNGNAFEAFIGAIYLDRGYNHCYRFINDVVFKHYINIDKEAKHEGNFKSSLIEWCQKHQFLITFVQEESREDNRRNIPIFCSQVLIEGISCGIGDGYSKKESDQNAARQALHNVKHDRQLFANLANAAESRREEAC
ncbi:MAG: ribonuclease III [Prevotellaceae bacterium]|nr:ribonuclease III [Prevotellaceae bacterium]